MVHRSRARRVSLVGARVQLADAIASLVNVSRTGVLIRAGRQLRPGSDWPLMLELNETPVKLTGRVVRLEPAAVSVSDGAVRKQFSIGMLFIKPSTEARLVLDGVCGTRHERVGVHLPFLHVSYARCCPRCGSRSVSRERPSRYRCDACLRFFWGFRIGPFRFAL